MVNGIDSLKFNPSPYGSIRRTGIIKNGRVFYDITDSKGKSAGNLSIPIDEADTFESSYNDIIETAPEIKNYVEANSSPYDIQHRKNMTIATVAGGGIIGGITGMLTTIGVSSAPKKILTIIGGALTGIALGFVASVLLTTPPGSIKFAIASKKMESLDIKKVEQ